MKSTLFLMVSPLLLSLYSCGQQDSRSIRTENHLTEFLSGVLDYQIGPSWGKESVTSELFGKETPSFKRAALATAKLSRSFGGATAFVLGVKDQEFLFATNHHVIGGQSSCNGVRLSFELLGVGPFTCDRVLVTNKDLDLTIFTVKGLNDFSKEKLRSVASSFSHESLKKGQPLLTVGYGTAGNPFNRLMAGQDEDCKVFSNDSEFRFIADPDEYNPSPYKTWAFASGCDVSHGDSGSAVVDRKTGEVMGILTTGKIPKNSQVRDKSFLTDIYNRSSNEVWTELTYVVPAEKIWEILGQYIP